MNILITGSTGFIASHLIPVLKLQNLHIIAAIRQNKTFLENVEERVINEINGNTDWTKTLQGIDTVFI